MFRHKNLLYQVIMNAITAAVVGLVFGLALGLLIWGIVSMLATLGADTPPIEVAAFLGMGVGTVLGAIFGGLVGLKGK